MAGMDVEDVRHYLLEHTDLNTRFPNWSSSLNLSHFLHVLSQDKPRPQDSVTAEDQAEITRLEEVSRQFKQYYLWVIVSLGLPGNLASLLTFLHMRSLGSCVVYVGVLAVVDSLALAEKLLLSLLQQHEVAFSAGACKTLLFLANALVIYANWIVVALAAERLFAVYRPLVLSAYWTRSRAAAGLVVLLLLSLLACVPVLVISAPSHDSLSCVHTATHRRLAWAWHWANVTLYGFLPCLLLLVINVAIISLLRRARRRQRLLCQGARAGGQGLRSGHESGSRSLATAGGGSRSLATAGRRSRSLITAGGESRSLATGGGGSTSLTTAGGGTRSLATNGGGSTSLTTAGGGSKPAGGSSTCPGSRSRSRQRVKGDGQRQVSVILLVASLVLIVLTIPRCALLLMQQLWRPGRLVLLARVRLVNQVTYALSDLNHAINFYLYFVSAPQFRRRFLDLFRSTRKTLSRLSARDTVQRRISDSESLRFLAVIAGPRPDSLRKSDGSRDALRMKTDAC